MFIFTGGIIKRYRHKTSAYSDLLMYGANHFHEWTISILAWSIFKYVSGHTVRESVGWKCSPQPEMRPGTYFFLIKNVNSSWKRHRNKSVVSDLFMYVLLLYLVLRILELSLGKIIHMFQVILNMVISDQFEQVWAFGCGNITEYTVIDLLIHTCVHKQHFNSAMGRPKP